MCFDYPKAAGITLGILVGGHEPWRGDPRQVAGVFFGSSARIAQETVSRAVYTIIKYGHAYHVTLVAAFPALKEGYWAIAHISSGPAWWS